MVDSPDKHLDNALWKLAKFFGISTVIGMLSYSALSPENLTKVGRALIGLQSVTLMGCMLVIWSMYKTQQELISEVGDDK